MPGIKIKEVPSPAVKPSIESEVLTSINPDIMDDSFIYVHCHFHNPGQDMLIRIWSTTYLIDASSGTRSKLVHAENISMAPMWTMIPDRANYTFLLVFSSLPKSCQRFDLVEEIAQPGGFHVSDIIRNETDVYHININ